MFYFVVILSILIFSYGVFLFILNKKIFKLEKSIINKFSSRTNAIPWLYEVTKNYFKKHNEVFKNIVELKKEEFTKIDNNSNFLNILQTEALIHKELNFIFKVCRKNYSLEKNHKFLYVREIIINKSFEIWNKVSLYKNIIKTYNRLINIKNYTIIWLLIPIYKKETI